MCFEDFDDLMLFVEFWCGMYVFGMFDVVGEDGV